MIRFFVEHPTAANLLMILIVAAGLTSLPSLQRTTFPDYALEQVGIDIVYPGAAASDVENAICARLDDAIEGIVDLKEFRCSAREGEASAVAEMVAGGDLGHFLDNINTRIDGIDDFPVRAEEPIIQQLRDTDFVADLLVSGDMSQGDLKVYVEDLKNRLLRLPAVSQVTIRGFSDRRYRIEIADARLRALGLSAAQVAEAVSQQSLDLPVGIVETPDRDVLIRFTGERQDIEGLESVVVVADPRGGELRIGDIGRVVDRFEREEQQITFEGRRAAVLELRKTEEEDSLRVMNAIDDFVAAERMRMPASTRFVVSKNLAKVVRDRLRMLYENGAQGLLLVFLAMAAFFPARYAFWVVIGLPVSFLGSFLVMALIGYSINVITTVALLMAIGVLMDDAIVLAENIARRAEADEKPLDAVIAGVREVAPGVFASFLTTVAVFGPLAFLEGEIGRVMAALPVVLIITLAVSLIEAFLILPHHLRHPTERLAARQPNRFRRGFETGFSAVRGWALENLVEPAIRHRYLVVGGLLAFVTVSAAAFPAGVIRFQAMPNIEGNVIEARLLMPQGTPLEVTERYVARVLDGLDQVDRELAARQPQDDTLIKSVHVRYAQNPYASEFGAHTARVVVDLIEAERRRFSLYDLFTDWEAAVGPLPGSVSLDLQEPNVGPQGRAIEIRVQGEDLAMLDAASRALQEQIRSIPHTRNVLNDLRPGKPEIHLTLKPGAGTLGLRAAQIASQLRGALLGAEADVVQVGEESFEIVVRQPPGDRDALADLEMATITGAGGAQIPLLEVAELTPARGWSQVVHVDGMTTVTVQGQVDARKGNAIDIISAIRAEVFPRLQDQYQGVSFSVEGQSSEAAETGRSIRRGFLLGLLGVFLVLSYQLRGYVEPLVVMSVIPVAVAGAFWGHFLLGYDISIPSLVGGVSLAGVVVNDSILLVYFIRKGIAQGKAVTQAAVDASRDRFRAVVLTSLTTAFGLLPLLAETSVQAQVIKPLVISIVFGILTSMVLVLVIIPALYSVLGDWREATGKGQTQAPEQG